MGLLKNISDRDRRLLFPALIAVGFILVLLIVDIPLYKKGTEMGRKAGEEEKRLNSIISMGKDYLSIKDDVEDIKARAFTGDGAALSGIDSVVGRSGLKKRLSSLKPATTPTTEGMKRVRAELSFEKVALADVSRLMAAFEAEGRPIVVERLSIKATYEDPSLFNVLLVVNMVEKD